MRLYVVSDLHLETVPSWSIPERLPDFDVAVIAGDLHCPVARSIEQIASDPVLQGKPVLFVPGNHEFDGGVLQDVLADGFELAAAHPHIHLLHRRSVIINGVRFIGATLWTDYELNGTTRTSMILAGQEMPDHKAIRYREPSGHISRFMPWHTRREHKLDRAFIEAELALPFEGPTVVVTHHLPSGQSIATRFVGNPLNPAFASELAPPIVTLRPALWVHGHTHHSNDYRIGETRILSNPKGYGPFEGKPRTENPGFDPAMIIDV